MAHAFDRTGLTLTICLGTACSRHLLSITLAADHMDDPNYRPSKAAQVVAYFILKSGERSLHILKLMKLVYLADRDSAGRWGAPILYEPRHSYARGPVNSLTYAHANGDRSNSDWSRFVQPGVVDHEIAIQPDISNGDLDELSRADIASLDAVWKEVGWMNEHVLCNWTHLPDNVSEWRKPPARGRLPIALADMLAAVGIDDADERARILGEARLEARPGSARIVSEARLQARAGSAR